MYLHHLRGTCALSSDDLSLLGYQQPQIIWLGTQSCLWRALASDIAEGSMSVLLHVAHMARLVEKVPAVVLEAFKAGHIPSAFLGQVAKSIQYWNHGERSHRLQSAPGTIQVCAHVGTDRRARLSSWSQRSLLVVANNASTLVQFALEGRLSERRWLVYLPLYQCLQTVPRSSERDTCRSVVVIREAISAVKRTINCAADSGSGGPRLTQFPALHHGKIGSGGGWWDIIAVGV